MDPADTRTPLIVRMENPGRAIGEREFASAGSCRSVNQARRFARSLHCSFGHDGAGLVRYNSTDAAAECLRRTSRGDRYRDKHKQQSPSHLPSPFTCETRIERCYWTLATPLAPT